MEFNFDDDSFDDAFFAEVDKLQVLATATTSSQPPPPPQNLPFSKCSPSLYPNPKPNPIPQQPQSSVHTHSPPRELSQRNPISFTSDEHFQIQRLKNELSSVSKELLDLKQECSELRKQRDTDQQLKGVYSSKKSRSCKSEDPSRNGVSPKIRSISATLDHAPAIGIERKSVGIQTDKVAESLNTSTSGATSTFGDLSKLPSIWHPLSGHRSQRNFVAKLLEACSSEFCALFSLDANISSIMDSKSFTCAPMPGQFFGQRSAEVSKISELYSVFSKLADDMVHINALVVVLLDLCSIENVLVVSRSLHILRIALEFMLNIDRSCSKRDNVKVERCNSGSDSLHIHDLKVENIGGVHDVDSLHLFSSMVEIAAKLTEEYARVEAISIMNIVLMRTDPSAGREKLGVPNVFKAVALLLRKEAGVCCRKEAVHLLYLLLNCPRILATFCSSYEEAGGHAQSPIEGAITLSSQEPCAVLEGLADCVVCSEHNVKDLSLRKNAIIMLSFLASSGKRGFEIFLFHKLSKRASFLGLVLQVLVSETDAEALESYRSSEILKERTSLMREALILLNRLASHPAYSTIFVQVLTSCRDMVSLAIDIATRLSKRCKWLLKSDSTTRQMREYEVVDLACLFRKRVFNYLGETISS